MRKLLTILSLLLLIAVPAFAAPQIPTPNAGAVAYMPVNSLSGLFGAKVGYRPQTGTEVIKLTFANGATAQINTRTGWVTYGAQVHRLINPIRVNGGNAFVPISELRAFFTGIPARVPPGRLIAARRNNSNTPVAPISSQIRFTQLQNRAITLGDYTPTAPTVIMGKAQFLLSNPGNIDPEAQVLLVYRGKFSTGGYSITVESLHEVSGVLHIGVKLTNPPQDGLVMQVETYPYNVVLLTDSISATAWQMSLGGSQLATGNIIK